MLITTEPRRTDAYLFLHVVYKHMYTYKTSERVHSFIKSSESKKTKTSTNYKELTFHDCVLTSYVVVVCDILDKRDTFIKELTL